MKQTSSKHQANVLKIHVHDVYYKFASCLLHVWTYTLLDVCLMVA